ncbi:MAG: hypothetical protein JWN47_2928, partial [Frankiales bacterium]|nr:hypothetical protein [Frankiales bacterium]
LPYWVPQLDILRSFAATSSHDHTEQHIVSK